MGCVCVCVFVCTRLLILYGESQSSFPWRCSQLDETSSLGDTHVLHEGLGLLLGDLAKPRLSKPVGEHVTSCWDADPEAGVDLLLIG